MEDATDNTKKTTTKRRKGRLRLFTFVILVLLAGAWLVNGGWNRLQDLGFPFPGFLRATGTPTASATIPPPTFTPSLSPTPVSLTETPVPSETPQLDLPIQTHDFPGGVILLSVKEGLYNHLFLYHPETLPLTRITTGPWDDIHPALSPNGRTLAFASNRGAFWDLYLLDILTGSLEQLTNTPEYEGHPTWSPDGLFLAYEQYGENLDLFIRPLDNSIEPIQLTLDDHADYQPAWSPLGRQVAFVSTRSGEPEIWLADLDIVGEDRFQNISRAPGSMEDHPSWSPDGQSLVWASNRDGVREIQKWNIREDFTTAIGSGDLPVYNPEGAVLLTTIETPNEVYLAAYRDSLVDLPPVRMSGPVKGMVWAEIEVPERLPESFVEAVNAAPEPLWLPAVTVGEEVPGGRQILIEIDGVTAPNPQLHDLVEDSFVNLRAAVAQIAGWDYLSTLENAFVPLTSPLPPGMGNDWLYTGRGIAVSSAPISAGWLKVVREDYGHQTFWRLYLRARFQDGSQGLPLHLQPWNLSARFSGSTAHYEQGGVLEEMPTEGYWIDFTELARAYGWERQPALLNWRTFYQGTRFNEYALPMGLDWRTAILDLYPPEVLITPSPIVPQTPSLTPTRTLPPTITPTPTRTPTATHTLPPSPTATETPTSPAETTEAP